MWYCYAEMDAWVTFLLNCTCHTVGVGIRKKTSINKIIYLISSPEGYK